MKGPIEEPEIAGDDVGIHFLRVRSCWGDDAVVEWGEIDEINALRNEREDSEPWIEIFIDHISGVDFRIQSGRKGYEQVMTAMEQHLLGFSRARVDAVGIWGPGEELPIVWRRDLVAQPFESRIPAVAPHDLTDLEQNVMEGIRNVTMTCAALRLGRDLERDEIRCIRVEVKDGKAKGHIDSPLPETLTRRQRELDGERGSR